MVRKKYPADQYQRDYREAHPKYVMRNRDLQKEHVTETAKKIIQP
jgi:hypothetical protein